MVLIKIRSKKYLGAIFLKVAGTKKDFICKVYPMPNGEEIADKIIDALSGMEVPNNEWNSSSGRSGDTPTK